MPSPHRIFKNSSSGYIFWQNRFLGSLKVYKFGVWKDSNAKNQVAHANTTHLKIAYIFYGSKHHIYRRSVSSSQSIVALRINEENTGKSIIYFWNYVVGVYANLWKSSVHKTLLFISFNIWILHCNYSVDRSWFFGVLLGDHFLSFCHVLVRFLERHPLYSYTEASFKNMPLAADCCFAWKRAL